jgi:hypothetical protein
MKILRKCFYKNFFLFYCGQQPNLDYAKRIELLLEFSGPNLDVTSGAVVDGVKNFYATISFLFLESHQFPQPSFLWVHVVCLP